MGYYTRYSLTWKPMEDFAAQPNCEHKTSVSAKFCPECGTPVGHRGLDEIMATEIKSNSELTYALNPDGTASGNETKWYDHAKDMLALSNRIPGVLFTLHGEGEEAGDLWNQYFLNGKMQDARAIVTIEAFDPDKLRTHQPNQKT